MVETYGSWKVISQSSIPTGIDLNVKIRYNGNSSLSVEFIDMAAGGKDAGCSFVVEVADGREPQRQRPD